MGHRYFLMLQKDYTTFHFFQNISSPLEQKMQDPSQTSILNKCCTWGLEDKPDHEFTLTFKGKRSCTLRPLIISCFLQQFEC